MAIEAKTAKERVDSNSVKNNGKINKKPTYSSRPSDSVLRLQHAVGNKALQRLFDSGFIQGKLTIGQPNDIYEQEADRVAEEVMRMPEPEIQRQPSVGDDKNLVQLNPAENSQLLPKIYLRKNHGAEQTPLVSDSLSSRIEAIKGGGAPLSKAERDFFEPRFGRDLSSVRIHNDLQANELAASANAQAFTYGKDIVFSNGKYTPASHHGKMLLAHELTHTIQQSTNYSSKGNGVNTSVGSDMTSTPHRLRTLESQSLNAVKPSNISGRIQRTPDRQPGEVDRSFETPFTFLISNMREARVSGTAPGVVQLRDYILFNFPIGSSEILPRKWGPDCQVMLEGIAQRLGLINWAGDNIEIRRVLNVEGYTDSPGSNDLNRSLRTGRSASFVDILTPLAERNGARDYIESARGAPLSRFPFSNGHEATRNGNRSVLISEMLRHVVAPIPQSTLEEKIRQEEPHLDQHIDNALRRLPGKNIRREQKRRVRGLMELARDGSTHHLYITERAFERYVEQFSSLPRPRSSDMAGKTNERLRQISDLYASNLRRTVLTQAVWTRTREGPGEIDVDRFIERIINLDVIIYNAMWRIRQESIRHGDERASGEQHGPETYMQEWILRRQQQGGSLYNRYYTTYRRPFWQR